MGLGGSHGHGGKVQLHGYGGMIGPCGGTERKRDRRIISGVLKAEGSHYRDCDCPKNKI